MMGKLRVSAGATLGLAIPLAADFFLPAGRPPTRAESQVPASDSSITIHARGVAAAHPV